MRVERRWSCAQFTRCLRSAIELAVRLLDSDIESASKGCPLFADHAARGVIKIGAKVLGISDFSVQADEPGLKIANWKDEG